MSEPANKKKDSANLHPDAAPDETALADLSSTDRPGSAVALTPGETFGEIESSDIKIPTFRIIQKMSDNPAKLDEGTMTVNGDTIVEGEDGTVVTVVSIKKQYEEILPFGAGIPQRFEKLEDAIKEGFKLCRSKQDRDSGVPLVEEAAIVMLACHQPDGSLDRAFPFDVAGKRVTPALWFLRSYAYGNIAKTIFSKIAFDLRGRDLLEAQWKVTTEKRKNSFGEFYVPHITLLDEVNSKEFASELRKQMDFSS